jgi:hypothetical protein
MTANMPTNLTVPSISLHADMAEKARRVADQLGLDPAELCRQAIHEYLDRHDAGTITARLNAVHAALTEEGRGSDDAFRRRANKRLATHVEWQ